MKMFIKWLFITGCAGILLVGAAIVILPRVVDVAQYKPAVEQKVSQAIGRPFHLGGDLDLSVFPWLGVSFTDLHLGNLPGFKEKDLLLIKSFEARVKLVPLLSKEIQISRIVLDGPQLILERRRDGSVSWEGLGKSGEAVKSKKDSKTVSPPAAPGETALPVKSLAVESIAVTHGRILWRDHVAGVEKEVSDVTLELTDVTLDKPVRISFSAVVDGKIVGLSGTLGPLGKDPGKGTIPMDITVSALNQISLRLAGSVSQPASDPRFEMTLGLAPFSLRKLMVALGQEFPVKTKDPGVLDRIALDMKLKGDTKRVAISDGRLKLDDSTMDFTANATDFSKPDITVDASLDRLDVDRYLPPAESNSPAVAGSAGPDSAPRETAGIDYAPLRKPIVDARFVVKTLKVHNATLEDLLVKVTGQKGVFNLDPLSMKLYQGTVSVKARFDARAEVPGTTVEFQTRGVSTGPLIRDVMAKDLLEGAMVADAALSFSGDTPESIQKNLDGKGELVFTDGAIVGIDLAGMVRNTASSFGLVNKDLEKPRTDFAELRVPFSIAGGIVQLLDAAMKSPLLRVTASGKVDLVRTSLDIKVDPKFVATLKGQGDAQNRKGLSVPVFVTGTFEKPKFEPDLAGILKNEMPDKKELKDLMEDKNLRKKKLKTLEQEAKGFLKGFELKK
ncbi:MAG: AsmA family protein [Pseudomonadota bacterium]